MWLVGPSCLVTCTLIGVWLVTANTRADDGGDRWQPQLGLELRPGSERSLARADLLWPLWQDPARLVFADLRLVDTGGSGFEGNLGLGFRQLLEGGAGRWLWGLYGFFDRRRSDSRNYLSQGTFGGEIHTERVSLRVNGYLPQRTARTLATRPFEGAAVSGTSVVRQQGVLVARERALPGFDLEAGVRAALGDDRELWLIGGYYRFARDGSPRVAGPRGRVEFRIREVFGLSGSELTLGAEVQHDDLRGTEAFALARLRIPLGRTTRTAPGGPTVTERRMTEFVARDLDVVTFAQNIDAPPWDPAAPDKVVASQEPVLDSFSGEPVDIFFVAAGATGDCSEASPCSLPGAQARAGPGDVLFLSNRGGRITKNVVLGAGQQLVGTGDGPTAEIPFPGGLTLRVADPSGRGTLAPPSGDAVTLADRTRVQGIAVRDGDTGIRGDEVSNVTIADVVVDNDLGNDRAVPTPPGPGARIRTGLHARNVRNLLVTGSVFRDILGDGIRIENGRDIQIVGNTIENTRSTGTFPVAFAALRAEVTTTNGSAIDVSVDPVRFTPRDLAALGDLDNLTVSGNTFRNFGRHGVAIGTPDSPEAVPGQLPATRIFGVSNLQIRDNLFDSHVQPANQVNVFTGSPQTFARFERPAAAPPDLGLSGFVSGAISGNTFSASQFLSIGNAPGRGLIDLQIGSNSHPRN